MVGIILAAGDGTRLRKSTGEDCCKALKKVNDKHLVEYALGNLPELGVDKVCIVVGKQGEQIKKAIGNEYKSLQITYVLQQEQKGLMNAMMQAVNTVDRDEDILLQLADEILTGLKSDSIKACLAGDESDFYCGITYEDDVRKIKGNYSVEIDEDFLLKKCTEKPTVVENNIKGTGFCIFRVSALEYLHNIYNEKTNTPNDLCDYMNSMVAEGKKGRALLVADREFNINTADDFNEAEEYVKSRS